MEHTKHTTRRHFLKVGAAALVALPVVGFSPGALAARNTALREKLQYQNTPKDGNSCATCKLYLPDTKGCSSIPDDNEIAPQDWCNLWAAKDK